MRDESSNVELSTARRTRPALPLVVDRATWRAKRDALLVRQQAHTRDGDPKRGSPSAAPDAGDGPEHPTVSVGDPPGPSIAEPANAAQWGA